jgi:hypothetical protein
METTTLNRQACSCIFTQPYGKLWASGRSFWKKIYAGEYYKEKPINQGKKKLTQEIHYEF